MNKKVNNSTNNATEDEIALRLKSRYEGTKWGEILKHRWELLDKKEKDLLKESSDQEHNNKD